MPQRFKLAYFVSHPIQYQAPLLKRLSDEPEIELTVFFLSGQSIGAYHDTGFNTEVHWDVPLTEGYKHHFLESETQPGDHGLFNPKVNLSSVRRALSSEDWDAVWIHGYNNLALLYLLWACARKQIPVLFRGESNLVSSPQGLLKDRFIRWLLKSSGALLWVSSDNREYYRHYGAPEEKLFFCPYAVNNDFFQQHAKISNRSSSHGKCVILFASKLIRRKHALTLVEAFSQLPLAQQDKAELWIVGDGEQRQAIEDFIDSKKLSDKVKLFGFKNQTELPHFMANCDVFVLPSEREPFGLVINEVMNFGKAIITTDEVGAAKDLVTNNENGWVIPANQQTALMHALSEAITEPKRLVEFGRKSLERINQWSYAQDVDGILKALKTVC